MKRDLKINYDQLDATKKKIDDYKAAVDNLATCSKKYQVALAKQNGAAYTSLNSIYADIAVKRKELSEVLELISSNIESFKSDMHSYAKPKDSSLMTRVDPDDVWFNYEQINVKVDTLHLLKYDTIGMGVLDNLLDEVYIPNPFATDEENAAAKQAVENRNAAARKARENNYDKLDGIRDEIVTACGTMNDICLASVKSIYDNKLTEYENCDDKHKTELKSVYLRLTGRDRVLSLIPDWMTVGFMEKMSKWNTLTEQEIKDHKTANEQAWKDYFDKYMNSETVTGNPDVYIERQYEMDDFKYGKEEGTISDITVGKGNINPDGSLKGSSNLCEIIAVYNALIAMNGGTAPLSFDELIEIFEKDGISLNGNIGSSMDDLAEFLNDYPKNKSEYESKLFKVDELKKKDFINLTNNYDTYILSTFNSKNDIRDGVHTMTITKEPDGKFRIHNDYEQTVQEYYSLEDAVRGYNERNSEPISLIGVKKKD